MKPETLKHRLLKHRKCPEFRDAIITILLCLATGFPVGKLDDMIVAEIKRRRGDQPLK